MKKANILTAIAVLFSTSAMAAEPVRYATINKVQPNYENVSVSQPRTVCRDLEVPIYGNSNQSSSGDVLGGMILGGILGKGVTGKDNGAAVGAILGGIVAADNNNNRQIVGYRMERQCQQNNSTHTERQLKNFTIWYSWNGHYGKSWTFNQYNVGDRIPVTVTVNAN